MGKSFWFDVETTGVDPEYCAIVQLAGIVEVGGKPVEEVELKMRPFDGADISMEALSVNSMTIEQVNSFEPWEKGMKKLIKLFDQYVDRYDKQDKMVVMGYRVDFDSSFLRAYFKRMGGDIAKFGYGSRFFNCPVDVMTLVGMHVLDQDIRLQNFKLSTVCAHFGIDLDAHDAMNDIRATRRLYQVLREKISGNSGRRGGVVNLVTAEGKRAAVHDASVATQGRLF